MIIHPSEKKKSQNLPRAQSISSFGADTGTAKQLYFSSAKSIGHQTVRRSPISWCASCPWSPGRRQPAGDIPVLLRGWEQGAPPDVSRFLCGSEGGMPQGSHGALRCSSAGKIDLFFSFFHYLLVSCHKPEWLNLLGLILVSTMALPRHWGHEKGSKPRKNYIYICLKGSFSLLHLLKN